MSQTKHKIILGDARCMTELKDRSVHLLVTSPPYWQLKDYGTRGEIGYNDTYEAYINHLNLVWQEAYRVLDKGCRLCINIGDQYARAAIYGRYKVIPIRTEIIKFCESIGFDYMGAIIWQKVATTNTSGGATIMGSFPYPRNGILKMDYEFILLFKKIGESREQIEPEIKAQSKMTKEEWNTYFSGHWNFPGEKQKGHLAMFPKELPHRLIKMCTFVGETVLDPFLGSGTTSLAALELGRNSIGYEINPEFIPLIEERLAVKEKRLFNKTTFQMVKQKKKPAQYKEKIEQLPYIFKDPVNLTPLIDPSQVEYGSKVHRHSGKRETYFRIKQILSPTKLLLNDNRTIELLGVLENPEKNGAAMAYLQDILKEQPVFLRFDPQEPEIPGETLCRCYLYLKNKTFINGRLIREGLVLVDEQREYRHKKRFLKYFNLK